LCTLEETKFVARLAAGLTNALNGHKIIMGSTTKPKEDMSDISEVGGLAVCVKFIKTCKNWFFHHYIMA
jgi:hypothetical protein